jgi:hypothetical protein
MEIKNLNWQISRLKDLNSEQAKYLEEVIFFFLN